MTEILEEIRESGEAAITQVDWVSTNGRVYECRVMLVPENAGGYSAHAMQLPGVVSEGESEEEALANIRDAFCTAIQVYLEEGQPIPWHEVAIEKPQGAHERWIAVDV